MIYQIEGRIHGRSYIDMKAEMKGKSIGYLTEGTTVTLALVYSPLHKDEILKIAEKYKMKVAHGYLKKEDIPPIPGLEDI